MTFSSAPLSREINTKTHRIKFFFVVGVSSQSPTCCDNESDTESGKSKTKSSLKEQQTKRDQWKIHFHAASA